MSKKIKKRKISLIELKDKYKIYNHLDMVEKIKDLIDKKQIEPIKNSEETPNYPRIKTLYWWIEVVEETSNKEELLREINFKLDSLISIDFYRNNIDKYEKDREYILKINNYLLKNKNTVKQNVAVNERSFEIFLDEKLLRTSDLKRILKSLSLDLEKDLNAYYTPEPFFYYSRNTDKPHNILIIENKDTFITVKKLMIEGYTKIFNQSIDTVIYGEGYKIISSFEDIEYDDTKSYLNYEQNKFYYWGDIDKEGFNIYIELKEVYETKNIILFKEAYDSMVNKFLEISDKYLPNKKNQDRKKKYNSIASELCGDNKDITMDILNSNCYIPQEIINNEYLRNFNII